MNGEFVMDCAKRVRAAGLVNVLVTNGFIRPEPAIAIGSKRSVTALIPCLIEKSFLNIILIRVAPHSGTPLSGAMHSVRQIPASICDPSRKSRRYAAWAASLETARSDPK